MPEVIGCPEGDFIGFKSRNASARSLNKLEERDIRRWKVARKLYHPRDTEGKGYGKKGGKSQEGKSMAKGDKAFR